jgi:hypothetical protein
MLSKGELLEAGAPGAYAHCRGAYAHCRRPPWALCHGAPRPTPLHHPLSSPLPPQAPLHLLGPRACLLCRPGCQNRSTGGLRSMALLNIVSGRSSATIDPRNRTPGDPSCLPRTFPTGPSPPLAGIELCPPAWRQGLHCDCSFRSRNLSVRNRDLFAKIQFSDLDPKRRTL